MRGPEDSSDLQPRIVSNICVLGPGNSPSANPGFSSSEKMKRVAEIRARRGRTPKFKGRDWPKLRGVYFLFCPPPLPPNMRGNR